MTLNRAWRQRAARHWPWMALALVFAAAVWHLVDFESDLDVEHPAVIRPTFSAYPPAAYRLAEPGDTIDRISLYLAGLAAGIAALGWGLRRLRREPGALWPAALVASLAAGWHAATPGPCFDGWHGLGWRSMLDPTVPMSVRAPLIAVALLMLTAVVLTTKSAWPDRVKHLRSARETGVAGLLLLSVLLLALRQVEIPGIGPAGYWPRWSFAMGLFVLVMAMLRTLPPLPETRPRRLALVGGAATLTACLLAVGLSVVWLHRPLGRFKAAVPGRIYISAMPTYEGLKVAHERHGFKTIINLFPEHTDQRSPLLPEEMRFVREHDIRYVLSPEDPDAADDFLDHTLALAQDPDAWPILVHCHGCMDRTPAWLGIYRFLVQGRPLEEVLREIEGHRGYRPKASVTLLYNHALIRLARERYLADPTGPLLIQNAAASPNPYDERVASSPEPDVADLGLEARGDTPPADEAGTSPTRRR